MADAEELKPDSPVQQPRRRLTKYARLKKRRLALEALHAGASGQLSREQVESVVARTRRGMRGVAPLAAEALVEIMVDPRVQPGTRVKAATFLLTGAGVTQTGVPVTEEERRRIDDEASAMDAMPVEALADLVYREAGATPLPEKAK